MENIEVTERGFVQMPEIVGTYGGSVQVYESSSAEEPHIWVKVIDENGTEAVLHLPLRKVKLFIGQLQYLKSNHYQVRYKSERPDSDR